MVEVIHKPDDGTNVDDLQLFLYDPISRAQLPLPPLSTISHFEDSFGDKVSGWNPAACIIAQVDASSSDAWQCIVVATFGDRENLKLICKTPPPTWLFCYTATMCITRITDLGNLSLFLGRGAAENPDKYDKNCIYFLQYMDYRCENEYPLVCREAVVYYVNDGRIKRCIPSIKTENLCLFMRWFSPVSILEYLISTFHSASKFCLALLRSKALLK
ncbi:hypothetical protein EPI10_032815 [Gossypium australe]|uniref:Uncharacterized protein n=1 Tax=Gossypium australe TaxID=47621 RepID=A0A5B6X7G7_9ROSI|nr:hypothetical protein EPI10_032815 [Gossypium australe]